MTTSPFIPFGLEDDDVEEFFALTEELSEATMQLLRDWVAGNFGYRGELGGARLVAYASEARLHLDVETRYGYSPDELHDYFPRSKDLLGLVQYLLYAARDDAGVNDLETLLWRGHSIWTVSKAAPTEPYRIVRRLPNGVAEAVREVASKSDLAGQHLTKAWNNAYGLDNDASVAYSSAIKAVETLACPLIEPKSARSTLGTALAALKSQHDSPKSTWEFTIENPQKADESVNTVVSMMKLLWHGQVDRHGSGPAVFQDATIEQARAAVLLAATLVGWLSAEYLVRTK